MFSQTFLYDLKPVEKYPTNIFHVLPGFKDSVYDNITPQEQDTVTHKNYLEYLQYCYSCHLGAEVTPDYLWYTILCEIAALVKEDPELYRDIFSPSKETISISVPTNNPVKLPVDLVIEKVFELVPFKTSKDLFLPKFSTTTDGAAFAFNCAFLDTVSPFYNYFMFACGFPKITVFGYKEDYKKIKQNLNSLSTWLKEHNYETSNLYEYIQNCVYATFNILINFEDKSFWEKIFYSERCGSGSQQRIFGWFTQFFWETPRDGMIQNFPTHISVVNYTNLDNGKSYTMNVGLFKSKEVTHPLSPDVSLSPEFGFYIVEKVK